MLTETELDGMLEWALRHTPTAAELREQAISFAYGNVHLDNRLVTREMVAQAYDDIFLGEEA